MTDERTTGGIRAIAEAGGSIELHNFGRVETMAALSIGTGLLASGAWNMQQDFGLPAAWLILVVSVLAGLACAMVAWHPIKDRLHSSWVTVPVAVLVMILATFFVQQETRQSFANKDFTAFFEEGGGGGPTLTAIPGLDANNNLVVHGDDGRVYRLPRDVVVDVWRWESDRRRSKLGAKW